MLRAWVAADAFEVKQEAKHAALSREAAKKTA
jgi:hypothetical protein